QQGGKQGARDDQRQDHAASGTEGPAPAKVLAADQHVGQDDDGDQQGTGPEDPEQQGAAEGAEVTGDLGLQLGQGYGGLDADRVELWRRDETEYGGLRGRGDAGLAHDDIQRVR